MRKNTSNQKTNNQKQSPVYIDIKAIIEAKGITLNRNGEAVTFKNGYQVGCKKIKEINEKNTQSIIYNIKKALRELRKGEFIGVWINEGIAYIDKSERVNTYKKAIKKGRKRGEQSVYEWATGLCLPVNA